MKIHTEVSRRRPAANRNEPTKIGAGHLRGMTEKAIEVVLDSGRVLWVPKSVIHDDSELYGTDTQGAAQAPGTHGTLIVARWWAAHHGFVKE